MLNLYARMRAHIYSEFQNNQDSYTVRLCLWKKTEELSRHQLLTSDTDRQIEMNRRTHTLPRTEVYGTKLSSPLVRLALTCSVLVAGTISRLPAQLYSLQYQYIVLEFPSEFNILSQINLFVCMGALTSCMSVYHMCTVTTKARKEQQIWKEGWWGRFRYSSIQ